MQIPELQSFIQRQGQFVKGLKAASFESQGPKLFPPGFNQIQPTGILRDELDWTLTDVDRQIVLNKQPAVRRKLANHLLQQLNMGCTISPRTHQDCCLPGGGFKGTMYPQLAGSKVARLGPSFHLVDPEPL